MFSVVVDSYMPTMQFHKKLYFHTIAPLSFKKHTNNKFSTGIMMMAGICSEAFPVFSEAFLSSQINALTSEVSKWILISVSSSADNACVKPGSKDAGSNFYSRQNPPKTAIQYRLMYKH